ncbi:ABC-type transport system, involved in lipoprotein release, permease component [Saccharicrinis carchari]|uniref:ABC-type transport system, involved in lipoprotein release, permease component n=1 Tax=Saccharicrinis carchari TaxID=1168039 RepID=A0A521ECT2_SACCC|nr:FtsX-like permease family protein [Saccharicrinis carchari]SMO80990.1 ABC-type transport system, involved in lipoprotein release, permease component [Saccharicrinis carchari]
MASSDLKMAWRNTWRNKRRTLITVASIFFGVLLSTLMTSMQNGTYAKMIDNVVSFYSGYLQIHHPDYWETKSIDDLLVPSDSLLNAVAQNRNVERIVPRMESFSLMSFQSNTKGGMLIGIEPEAENELTKLKQWVGSGRYLEKGDDGILMAINLAKALDVQLGDTVALISQGYHGYSASGLFPVVGILEFPFLAMNNFGTYISLDRARDFFSAPGMVTSLVLTVDHYDDVESVKHHLASQLGADYSVMTWDEMDPVTKQMIEGDKGQGIIMKGILYILIGFGIFSTVIMMIAERRKELGVMVAVGMNKLKLAKVLFYETMLIGAVGVASGFAVSVPVVWWMVRNPLPLTGEMADVYEQFGMEPAIYFGNDPMVFWGQILIVFGITLLVSIYPLSKILRLKVTRALYS